jgi:hypothetical protein
LGKQSKFIWILFAIVFFTSLFFRVKIIHELPLGITANEYGLTGFDDEPAHFNYVKFLLDNKSFPVLENTITDADALTINEFEYRQPPLYYLVVATISSFLNINNPRNILLLGRYFNLILALLSVLILYKIFLALDWEQSKILTTLSIYLLLGCSVYQFSLFGNDALSWFILWSVLLLVLNGILKNWILIIVLLTLSHYTKAYTMVYYPIIAFAALRIIMSDKKNIQIYLKIGAVFVVPFILVFPWYLRNYFVYGNFFEVLGETWYWVSSFKESIIKILHMPYSFLFRMQFDPPKPLLSWFNYIPNIWLMVSGVYWIVKMKDIRGENYKVQIINLLLLSMIGAYLYYALPTGYTEGRLLYPGLPAILYFMTEVLYQKRIEKMFFEGWQLAFIVVIILPSYIVGFYL